MKKNILIFGLLMGLVLCIPWLIVIDMMYTNPEFKSNDLLGYAIMVVIYSLLFFGVRNYRNKELGGFISFGKAFKTGAFITLLAGTVYVVLWMFYYYLVVPDFMEVYAKHVLHQCTSEEELAAKTKEMEWFSDKYQNPIFIILLTYAEVIPIGLIVSLISALILKKKQKPATIE